MKNDKGNTKFVLVMVKYSEFYHELAFISLKAYLDMQISKDLKSSMGTTEVRIKTFVCTMHGLIVGMVHWPGVILVGRAGLRPGCL